MSQSAHTAPRYTYLVTGGTSGIGREVVKRLLQEKSTHVIFTGRTQAKIDEVHTSSFEPITNTPDASSASSSSSAFGIPLDMNSFEKIRAFVKLLEVHLQSKNNEKMTALVLNAGLQVNALIYTCDEIETTFACNHLGTFLLARLLLPMMDTPSRILVTSSATHDPAQGTVVPPPNYTSLEKEVAFHPSEALSESELAAFKKEVAPAFNPLRAYSTSKLCNVMFVYGLQERLSKTPSYSNIVAIAYDPGWIPGTALARESWAGVLLKVAAPIISRVSKHGSTYARTVAGYVNLIAPSVDGYIESSGGEYWSVDQKIKSSERSYDAKLKEELWEKSCLWTGLPNAL